MHIDWRVHSVFGIQLCAKREILLCSMGGGNFLCHEANLPWPDEDPVVRGQEKGQDCKGSLLKGYACPVAEALTVLKIGKSIRI